MLAAGVSSADIAEVVRVMQWELLHALTYQLADPGVVDYPSPDIPHIEWALFELDSDGNPRRQIGGLHESVLWTDPTGREMRPEPTSHDA